MSKLKNARCIKCDRMIGRHDKKRIAIEVRSANPCGAKVSQHLQCGVKP